MLPTVKLAGGNDDPERRHDEKPFIAPQPDYRGKVLADAAFTCLTGSLECWHSLVNPLRITGKVNLNTLIGAMGLVLLVVGALLVWQAYRLSGFA